MRYRLTAEVQGHSVAAAPFEWEGPNDTVGLVLGDKGRVTHVWAEERVTDFEPYLPRIIPYRDKPSVINIPPVPARERLLGVLQYLESLGAFWLGIERIAWGTSQAEWLADSDDEKARITLSAFSSKLEYPATPITVEPEVVARILGKRASLDYLTIPLSFYREGTNDFRDHKYVPAFYNFYFVIEDLYGKAKTKNRAVLQAFRESAQLRAAFAEAYVRLEHADFAQHKASLLPLMRALQSHYSVDGLMEFTVMIRGELHHFSQASSRPKGHPFNQNDFRSVAFLALTVCIHIIRDLANGTPLDLR